MTVRSTASAAMTAWIVSTPSASRCAVGLVQQPMTGSRSERWLGRPLSRARWPADNPSRPPLSTVSQPLRASRPSTPSRPTRLRQQHVPEAVGRRRFVPGRLEVRADRVGQQEGALGDARMGRRRHRPCPMWECGSPAASSSSVDLPDPDGPGDDGEPVRGVERQVAQERPPGCPPGTGTRRRSSPRRCPGRRCAPARPSPASPMIRSGLCAPSAAAWNSAPTSPHPASRPRAPGGSHEPGRRSSLPPPSRSPTPTATSATESVAMSSRARRTRTQPQVRHRSDRCRR